MSRTPLLARITSPLLLVICLGGFVTSLQMEIRLAAVVICASHLSLPSDCLLGTDFPDGAVARGDHGRNEYIAFEQLSADWRSGGEGKKGAEREDDCREEEFHDGQRGREVAGGWLSR